MSTRQYALVGVIIIIGVLTGVVYASNFHGQSTVVNVVGMQDSVDDRIALENMAIEIALADPRVKPLFEGKECTIQAFYKKTFQLKFVDNNTETFYAQWDGQDRASVQIRYPDNNGYWIEVNITNRIVDEPRKVVWEDKGTLHFIN